MSGEYKACGSSIMIDDSKGKIFLLLCVDMPNQTAESRKVVEGKTLFARIGIAVPIIYMVDIKAKNDFDTGRRIFEIGTSEYFHRRLVLQNKIHKLQKSMTDTTGGHGRKKKTKALERFRKAETNYVKTMMHKYSRMLVDAAVYYKCERIVLLDQEKREEDAKVDKFVLRNWGYGGLKGLIEYKCKMAGVVLEEEKSCEDEEGKKSKKKKSKK